MFLLQLTNYKRWLLRGATFVEMEEITQTLAGMHWSAVISYEKGRLPSAVQFHDCGFEQRSLCMVPVPDDDFEYTDGGFLCALGITYDGLVAPRTCKYDAALAENPGRIIVVRCGQCNEDYDVREVVNERQHPAAAHVMAFDCPRGHRSEARRVFKTG